MPSIGALRERIRFDRRALDINGDRAVPWQPACTVWAQLSGARGGETVLAQRLQGEAPANITVRYGSLTRDLDNSFRAVHLRTGDVYDVKDATPDERRKFIFILAVNKIGQANDG